jgi:hypothetical protein
MNDKHKIELNIPPVYTRNDVIIGEQVPPVGFLPFSIAYGPHICPPRANWQTPRTSVARRFRFGWTRTGTC